MRHRSVLSALGVVLLLVTTTFSQTSTPADTKTAVVPARKAYTLPHLAAKAWTGDLDGMIKRRMIRVLVPYSKTLYFVDRGTQRGLLYEMFRLFEDDFNKKLKKKRIRVQVFFMPTGRDELIPSLLAGRGDIAAANLTITPERLKQVDFSNATRRDLSEIVVTGPGVDPIMSAHDLSGRQVYVRKSTSFFESLDQLNAELVKAGKAPVKVRPAPDDLETEDILEMVNAGLVDITIADDFTAEFWAKIFPKLTLNKTATVRTGGNIAWMIRKDSPQFKAAAERFSCPLSRGLEDTQHTAAQVSPERQVRQGCGIQGRARQVRTHRRRFPQVRRKIRTRLPADDGPGLPGISAQPESPKSEGGDRRDAGDAGDGKEVGCW